MNMQDVRARFPQYEDLGDVELATALHRKFYSDIPVGEFYQRLGLTEAQMDPAEGMSAMSRGLAGFQKAMKDTGRGIVQALTPDDSESGRAVQASIDEAKRLDAPLMNTTGGTVGNVIGYGAIAAPTAIIPGANTVLGSAALGGLMGGLQPTATGESTIENAATGFALGGAGQAIGNAIPKVAGALVRPFTEGGRNRIVGEVLERFAREPDAIANAAATQSAVPGVQFTLAEASGDRGLAALQRAAQSLDPSISAELGERAFQNTQAVRGALAGIAGDDTARAAAVTARKQAAEPLYTAARSSVAEVDPSRTVSLIDRLVKANPANRPMTSALADIRDTLFESYPAQQRGSDAWKVLNDALQGRNAGAPGSVDMKAARTVLDRLRKGTIDAGEAVADLKKIKPKGKAFTEALDLAKQYVETPDYVVRQNPRELISAVENIKSLLAKEDNAFVKRELTTVKNSLLNQIKKTVPEFSQAERTFAQMSQPINQMDIGRALYNKLVPALADVPGVGLDRSRAANFAELLRGGDKLAKDVTGMKSARLGSILNQGQQDTLGAVTDYLARRAAVDAVPVPRSDTAVNLASQNIIRQIVGPLGLPQSWAESVAGKMVGRPISAIARPAEERLQQQLVQALADPQRAATLMQSIQPSQAEALAQALYQRALPVGSVGSGAYAAGQ